MPTFIANRLSAGNTLFPLELHILSDGVTLRQNGLFTSKERTIPRTKIASVCVSVGPMYAAFRIESSGGSDDIVGSGFKKEDAVSIKREVQKLIQQKSSTPQPAAHQSSGAVKSCPFCAETILLAAKKCRYCGEFLES